MGNKPDVCLNFTWITNQTSYEILSECWTEKWLADVLRFALPLIILPISLINNFLSFIALRSRHMRGTSTAFFMLALSVLDPLVLITKNLVYFPNGLIVHGISCKILYFLIYVLGYTNVWILVIMTGDKFFAVWFPLKVSYFCTISRAKYICLILLFLTSLVSFHHFWTIDSFLHPKNARQRFCYYYPARYAWIQHLWRYIDFVIWCFLPFILIFTLSVLIIYKLHQRRQSSPNHIRHLIGTSSNGPLSSINRHQPTNKTSQDNFVMRSNQNTDVIRSRHRHITFMLLSVAVVFLLLTLPNSIYFVLDLTYGFNRPPTADDYSQWLRYRRLTILTVIMFQLSDLQHATNFFLYLLTSHKFRRAVLTTCLSMGQGCLTFIHCSVHKHVHGKHSSTSRLSRGPGRMSCRSSTSDVTQNSRTVTSIQYFSPTKRRTPPPTRSIVSHSIKSKNRRRSQRRKISL